MANPPRRWALLVTVSALVTGCATAVPDPADREAALRDAGRECEREVPGAHVTGIDPQGRLIVQTRGPGDSTMFSQCVQRRMQTRVPIGVGQLVIPPSGARRVTVPIEVSGSKFFVWVTVNGTQSARLLLDTGASITVLNPRLMARLGVDVPATAPKMRMTVVGGGTLSVPQARVKSLTVGDVSVENIDVGVIEVFPSSTGVDGLIGANFLAHFKVTVDRNVRQLTLEIAPPSLLASELESSDARTWPAPAWTPGDEWRFRWESPTARGTFVRRVEGEETIDGVAHYAVKSGDRMIYYVKDTLGWHLEKVNGVTVDSVTPPFGFDWPLRIGKRWELTYRWEFPRIEETREEYRLCQVRGEESMTVAAGTFATLHVICRDRLNRVLYEAWYAPSVKYWVKERRVSADGDNWRELVSYKVR